MHRSGTSATAGALSRLGMHLGDRLVPGASDNPDGYFEHAGVVLANETLLDALDRSWDDVRALPEGWLRSRAADHTQETIRGQILPGLRAPRPWAMKDPRMCRLLPLWLRVLADEGMRAGCLFVVRHPDEVAASLKARDAMPPTVSNILWLRHLLEAAEASTQVPRTALTYERLLAEPATVLREAAARLGVVLGHDPQTMRTFVNARSRHHKAGGETPAADEWQALARDTYALFVGNDDPWEGLESVRVRFDALVVRHADWIAVLGARSRIAAIRCDSLRRENLQTEARSNLLQQTLDAVNAASLERLAELQALGAQLAATQSALATAERDALARLDELHALSAQMKTTEAAKSAAEGDALARLAELHALAAQLEKTEAAKASAERDALARLAEVQTLGAQLAATQAAQASAEGEALARLEDLHALTARLKATEAAQASAERDALARLEEARTLGAQLEATQAAQASAEGDALARLEELHALTAQLRATEAAQASAERDALARLEEAQTLGEQLEATQAAQASAEGDALARLEELHALTAQLRATEAAQASAEGEALARLEELHALTAQLRATEAAQASAERDALARLEEAQTLGAQLEATQAAQASAEGAALARLEELRALTAQLKATEAAQASAEGMALSRLAELGALDLQLAETRMALASSATLASDRQARIAQLEKESDQLRGALDTSERRHADLLGQLETAIGAKAASSAESSVQETGDARVLQRHDLVTAEMAEIHASGGWRLLMRLRALRRRLRSSLP